MAEEEHAIAEVMSLLESEPSSGPAGGIAADLTAPGPDIPALRDQLAVLVSTGKAKDAIGVQLTHNQMKRLSDKDVEKYYKRYETHVGSFFLWPKRLEWPLTSKTSTLIRKNSETTTSSTKSSTTWPATLL